MQTAGARAGEVLAAAPFGNGNVDACQGQFACQHQPGRARAHDQDIGTRHGLTAPVVRNGGFQPPASPPKRRARALFLRPQKLRANRSSAILELIYFGPISGVTARISISCYHADAAERAAWRSTGERQAAALQPASSVRSG